jgi:hypothetical protein
MASSWCGSAFVAGCKPPEGARPPGTESEKTAQVTVWGERFEVFIEHPPVVAGFPARFATHVTDTAATEPRREGPVKFVLRADGHDAVEHVEPAPVRPGIYTAELTFPRPGEWIVEVSIPTEAGESRLMLPPLTAHVSHEAAAQAATHEAPEGVVFLKEQQWKMRTRVEPAGRHRLVERLRVAGRVAARPASRAEVSAPLAGRLLAPARGPLP